MRHGALPSRACSARTRDSLSLALRLLIDSNIWRYLTDAGAIDELRIVARKTKVRVLVAPAVVYEAMRVSDPRLRYRLAQALTLPDWKRLMPEAYSEAEEFKVEVRRLRPAWIRKQPDLASFKRLRHDWASPRGGFWDRVRHDTQAEATRILGMEGAILDVARSQARALREQAESMPREFATTRLCDLMAAPTQQPPPGWPDGPVELWRLDALRHWGRALMNFDSTHREWAEGEVDIPIALSQQESWAKFWLQDVGSLPKCWLRTACEYLQRFSKVSDGAPVDVQLATYLADADVMVSADKLFVRITERCREEAPFAVAKGVRLPGGDAAATELFSLMEQKVSARARSA